mgnify:CR=1 FL=1
MRERPFARSSDSRVVTCPSKLSNTFGAFHLSLSARVSQGNLYYDAILPPFSSPLRSRRVPRSHATATCVYVSVCVCVCVCAFEFRRSLAYPGFLRPFVPSPPRPAPCSLAMFARYAARSLTYSWVYGTINPLRDSIITEAIKHLNV